MLFDFLTPTKEEFEEDLKTCKESCERTGIDKKFRKEVAWGLGYGSCSWVQISELKYFNFDFNLEEGRNIKI